MQILGKAEFLNPGGSVKDRVALRIVQEALVSVETEWCSSRPAKNKARLLERC